MPVQTPPAAAPRSPLAQDGYPPPAQAWFALVAFCVAAILSYTDRQILSLLVDPLRAEFALSDTQVSLLQGVAFALIYACAGLPLGRMADILPRKRVIVGGVLLWSAATIWCGLARSFGELFVARSVVGIGEAALAPAATSMIADYFAPRRRGTATGLFLMGQVIGAGLAIAVGGTVLGLARSGAFAGLPAIGLLPAWRITLLLLGMPGLLVALLIALTVEPPRRHARDAVTLIPLAEVLPLLAARRGTLAPLYAAMALLSVGDFALQNWMPALLSRRFGFTPGEIAAQLGTAAIVGAVLGTVAAGSLSDRLAGRGGSAARLPVATIAALLALPGAAIALASTSGAAILLFMLWVVMSNAAGAIGITAVQELAPATVRGVALALISFFNMTIGLGFGTTATALLTDRIYAGPGAVALSMSTVALPAAIASILCFYTCWRTSRTGDRAVTDA